MKPSVEARPVHPLYHLHLDGFPAPAEAPRVLEVLPSTVEPWLRACLESEEPLSEEERARPRFVGVDLPIGEAYALLERLRQAGAMGHLVPGPAFLTQTSVKRTATVPSFWLIV